MPKSSQPSNEHDSLMDAILQHFDANRVSVDAAMRQLNATTDTIYAYLGMERPKKGGKADSREKLSKGDGGG